MTTKKRKTSSFWKEGVASDDAFWGTIRTCLSEQDLLPNKLSLTINGIDWSILSASTITLKEGVGFQLVGYGIGPTQIKKTSSPVYQTSVITPYFAFSKIYGKKGEDISQHLDTFMKEVKDSFLSMVEATHLQWDPDDCFPASEFTVNCPLVSTLSAVAASDAVATDSSAKEATVSLSSSFK